MTSNCFSSSKPSFGGPSNSGSGFSIGGGGGGSSSGGSSSLANYTGRLTNAGMPDRRTTEGKAYFANLWRTINAINYFNS